MRIRGRNTDVADGAGEGSRFSAVGDALWTAQDRARTGSRRAFKSLWWTLRDRVVLPLRDHAELAGAPARALGAGALVLLAAGLGVAALLFAAPDHGKTQTTVAEVAAPIARPAAAPKSKPAKPPAPRLHGAAPVFEAGGVDEGAGVGGVEADTAGSGGSVATGGRVSSSGAGATNAGDEAAATKISSRPGSSTSPATTSTSPGSGGESRPARGPVAGPAAVAVARRFATAFVSYEVGGAEDPAVRGAFAATTVPALEQALLQRPPRLPANVKVPQAKVLNIVPAPSRDHVFPVSVSLLRLGTTSELRLEMAKQKGKGWLVTNVLG